MPPMKLIEDRKRIKLFAFDEDDPVRILLENKSCEIITSYAIGQRGEKGHAGESPHFYGFRIDDANLIGEFGDGLFTADDYICTSFLPSNLTLSIDNHEHLRLETAGE